MAESLQQQLSPGEGVNQSNTSPASTTIISNNADINGNNFDVGIESPHRNFLDAISLYAASIPLKNFWVARFDIPKLITESNLKNLSEEFSRNDKAKALLAENTFQNNQIGCIFCRSVDFVGEKNESDILQVQTRGFRPSPIVGYRSGNFLNNLTLSFYESSVSFIDHIIRPWTILMSYYGTVTRNPSTDPDRAADIANLRRDIECIIFTRGGSPDFQKDSAVNIAKAKKTVNGITTYNYPSKVRKIITFKNCFPTTFSNIDYNHNETGNKLETVNTTFSYSHYEIKMGASIVQPR